LRKELLSNGENKPVLRIPSIVGISPIIVEPQAVLVALKLEDKRIAIRVSFV